MHLCEPKHFFIAVELRGMTEDVLGMTEDENRMMRNGTYVYSTSSFQQLVELFGSHSRTYYRTVRYDTNFTSITDKWSTHLILPAHIFIIEVRDTRGV